MNQRLVAYVLFVVVAVATYLVYFFLSKMPHHIDALLGLAFINALIGLWIIRVSDHRQRALIMVAMGLLIAQWWLLLLTSTFLIWHFFGFAP